MHVARSAQGCAPHYPKLDLQVCVQHSLLALRLPFLGFRTDQLCRQETAVPRSHSHFCLGAGSQRIPCGELQDSGWQPTSNRQSMFALEIPSSPCTVHISGEIVRPAVSQCTPTLGSLAVCHHRKIACSDLSVCLPADKYCGTPWSSRQCPQCGIHISSSPNPWWHRHR